MVIGKIKGYSVCNITKKQLKNDAFFEEIENVDTNIRKKITENIENKGYMFGIKKDKKLKGIYLFEEEDDEKGKILKFKEKILTEEINGEIEKEVEETVLEDLKEPVSLEEYKKVVWNDIEIEPQTVKIGKFEVAVGTLGLALGIILGIVFDDLALWLPIGIVLSLSSGAIVNVNGKKKK